MNQLSACSVTTMIENLIFLSFFFVFFFIQELFYFERSLYVLLKPKNLKLLYCTQTVKQNIYYNKYRTVIS